MRRVVLAAALVALGAAAQAQVSPTPSFDDPRMQTVAYDPARPVRLVMFPDASLAVTLLAGEQIERLAVSDPQAFEAQTTPANDGFIVRALRPGASARMLVDTAQRRYEFDLATGDGLAAARVVRFVGSSPAAAAVSLAAQPAPAPEMTGEYRLSGEATLLPSRIADDGTRTYLEWDAYQSLPAVFGIGFNGEEEVVDGYMRNGVFTIDRVYGELVFRIDKMRARARRTVKVGAG